MAKGFAETSLTMKKGKSHSSKKREKEFNWKKGALSIGRSQSQNAA